MNRTISYDAVGNPQNWHNGTKNMTHLTWLYGRQLVGLNVGNVPVTYSYDANGIRTTKTVGGTSHHYVTLNGKVAREEYTSGSENRVLDFIYDESGNPFMLRYSTNGGTTFAEYYYILNMQGDVVRIVDSNRQTVASYEYNAWGEIIDASGTLRNINPLRYRGYYYDEETGFYYLQSRYYDPQIGRFINADSFASTGQSFLGYNMFEYCNNSPVMGIDSHGTWTFGTVIGGALFLGIGIDIEFGLFFDSEGNVDLTYGYSIPGVDNTLCMSILGFGSNTSLQYTSDETLNDMYGSSTAIGGGIPIWGPFGVGLDLISPGNANQSQEINGVRLSATVGKGMDFHVITAVTQSIFSVVSVRKIKQRFLRKTVSKRNAGIRNKMSSIFQERGACGQ